MLIRPWMSSAPAAARRSRRLASAARRRSCAASAFASPDGNSSPVSPSRTSSGLPPTFDATAVAPHAIASIRAFDNASDREGKTKMSIAFSHRATSGAAGSNTICAATPSRSADDRSSSLHRSAADEDKLHAADFTASTCECFQQNRKAFLRTKNTHRPDHKACIAKRFRTRRGAGRVELPQT